MTRIHDHRAVHATPPGTPAPLRDQVCPRHLIGSEPSEPRCTEPYVEEARARLALERAWARVGPLLPAPAKRRLTHPGRRPVPDRVVLSVVLHVLREQIPWHTARTGELGCSGVTAWRRLRHWARSDTWPRIREAILSELDGPARRRAVHALGSARTTAYDCAAPSGPAPLPVPGSLPRPAPLAAPPEPEAGPHTDRGEDDDALLVAAITRAVATADDAVLGPLLKRLAGRADTRVVLRLGEALAAAAAADRASRTGQREPASTSVHARPLSEAASPTPTSVNRQSTRS